MEITSSVLERERPLVAAEAEFAGEEHPIKLRLPVLVRRRKLGLSLMPGDEAGVRYEFLKGVRWILSFKDAGEAVAAQDTLSLFFSRLAVEGPEAMRARLLPTPPSGQ